MSYLEKVNFRMPSLEDGMAVNRLVASCPPLDPNSSYCNILQCGHFSATSVAAEVQGELVGFISGYRVPDRPDTLFIWQVAVGEKARGCGLASKMLAEILARPESAGVSFMETTITEDNKASWALFEGFAKKANADCQSSLWLDETQHFDGEHASEMLVRIGPFQ